MTWTLKEFDALSPAELYAILQLRNEVFVVEQQCVFQDADDKDQVSKHLMGYAGGELLAYCRLVPPGTAYTEVSIGRVVTSPKARRSGAGKELMRQALSHIYTIYGKVPVKIGAQLYLRDFYASFGFRQEGNIYLEDGIEHIYMNLP